MLVGEVKQSEKNIAAEFDVQSFPTLVVLSPEHGVVRFEGKLNRDSLKSFLDQYALKKAEKIKQEKKPEKKVIKKVEAIDSNEAMKRHCLDTGFICVVAITDDENKQETTDVLNGLKQKKTGYEYGWIHASQSKDIAHLLQLPEDYPSLFILHPTKQVYRNYVGAFDEKNVQQWLERIQSGTLDAWPYKERQKEEVEELEQRNQELLQTIHTLTCKINQLESDSFEQERKKAREVQKIETVWETKLKTIKDEYEQEIVALKSAQEAVSWDPWSNESSDSYAKCMQHSALSEISSTQDLPPQLQSQMNSLLPKTPPDSALAFSSLLSNDDCCYLSDTWYAKKQQDEASKATLFKEKKNDCFSRKTENTSDIPFKPNDSSTDTLSSSDNFLKPQLWTQTMVGYWMWKYTRNRLGLSVNRHKRFFWIHPYTRILYWSTQEPGKHPSEPIKNVLTLIING
ncbi:hypothetical protein G6F56_002964 [Rhizopus delemar]|nr:hypothetical protein G6F56_002964 [Rhizopus delemar]